MHVAIIPARAGSKSIINKNLIKLGREGITERAIRLAKECRKFDRIILTTDIPVLVDRYLEDPQIEVRVRPPEMGEDHTLMADTIVDVIRTMKIPLDTWLWLLQPTSPFRRREDFITIMEIVKTEKYKSVISVRDVGPTHPDRMYTLKNNRLYPFRYTCFKNKGDLLPVYLRNGAFYVLQAGDLMEKKSFYVSPCAGLIMPERRSVNIDGPLDYEMAKVVMQQGEK